MTANFSPSNAVDLTKIIKIKNKDSNASPQRQQLQLMLQSNPITPAGKYTLGIDATDGTVTKSIFLDLLVRTKEK